MVVVEGHGHGGGGVTWSWWWNGIVMVVVEGHGHGYPPSQGRGGRHRQGGGVTGSRLPSKLVLGCLAGSPPVSFRVEAGDIVMVVESDQRHHAMLGRLAGSPPVSFRVEAGDIVMVVQ